MCHAWVVKLPGKVSSPGQKIQAVYRINSYFNWVFSEISKATSFLRLNNFQGEL